LLDTDYHALNRITKTGRNPARLQIAARSINIFMTAPRTGSLTVCIGIPLPW
jgi:hypothetical protein